MSEENGSVSNAEILPLTVSIVSAHAGANPIRAEDLPGLMSDIHACLGALGKGEARPEPLVPAVPIKKSVTDGHIICLEDGKKLKMLKRYLRTRYDLSPEEYRARWGLPSDYPMVAPEYARRRSSFAKEIGLGKKS